MGRRFVAVLAVTVVTLSCSAQTEFNAAPQDAVDCRELGGGWIFARFEQGDAWSQGVRLGLPTGGQDFQADPDATEEEFEEATRLREAEGWDDEAVSALSEPDAPADLTARLEQMPSCLDELRATQG
ncbi:MAG: hypothetical protein JJT89_18340 [Nitriliruptoraceae bacterium]|nr:hypothetical protein [Nitriliruptoraceae bacterium]